MQHHPHQSDCKPKKESIDEQKSTDISDQQVRRKKHKTHPRKAYPSRFFSGQYQQQYQKHLASCENLQNNIQLSFHGQFLRFTNRRTLKKFNVTEWLGHPEQLKFAASTFKAPPQVQDIPPPDF